MIKQIQRLTKRYAFRTERRKGNGDYEKHGGDDGQGAGGNHMNSFSFFRSLYKPATCSA